MKLVYRNTKADRDMQSASQLMREANDCTVDATAYFLGCSYHEAHATLAKRGRKKRHGFTLTQHIKRDQMFLGRPAEVVYNRWVVRQVRRSINVECGRGWVAPRGITLGTAVERYMRQGTFLVSVRHHVLAVQDGVVLDSRETPARAIVRSIYRRLPLLLTAG